jgi:adenylosuccinate synthase
VSVLLSEALEQGKAILAEGAQGTLLDIDFGTYPFVTSSNPTAGGACVGLGIGPTEVTEVIGITKAYTTRVGRGPFPSELPDDQAEAMRQAGGEYGATTGRPRRCGWLDVVALRHSRRVNGLTGLCVTKLDVLDGLDELKICIGYELDGRRVESFPPTTSQLERCRPVYESFPGWEGATAGARRLDDLPKGAKAYLDRVSALAGAPVVMASVGSGREQTIGI